MGALAFALQEERLTRVKKSRRIAKADLAAKSLAEYPGDAIKAEGFARGVRRTELDGPVDWQRESHLEKLRAAVKAGPVGNLKRAREKRNAFVFRFDQPRKIAETWRMN